MSWSHLRRPMPNSLEWFLLTTCEIPSAEQAQECLRWYCLRWRIEDWHRVLKRSRSKVGQTRCSGRAAPLKVPAWMRFLNGSGMGFGCRRRLRPFRPGVLESAGAARRRAFWRGPAAAALRRGAARRYQSAEAGEVTRAAR
jgi:hypothetical protein